MFYKNFPLADRHVSGPDEEAILNFSLVPEENTNRRLTGKDFVPLSMSGLINFTFHKPSFFESDVYPDFSEIFPD